LHDDFYNNIAFDKCPQIANSTAFAKSVLPSRSWLGARSPHSAEAAGGFFSPAGLP
jgi:hypothetical protein